MADMTPEERAAHLLRLGVTVDTGEDAPPPAVGRPAEATRVALELVRRRNPAAFRAGVDDPLTPEQEVQLRERTDAKRREHLDAEAPRLGATADEAFARMSLWADGTLKPIPTPWPALNRVLAGGLRPGLHVLTGTTGAGKTQLALQVAARAAAHGTPTLYVALELGRDEITARMASILLADAGHHVMWSDVCNGTSASALELALDVAGPALRRLPFRLEEAPAGEWCADNLEERLLDMKAAHGERPPLLVLDYLQAVGPSENDLRGDLRMAIRSAAFRARNVARQGATVLLLSSVAREKAILITPGGPPKSHVRAPDGDPTALVGLGKESGEIEFSADSVLTLSRGEYAHGATPMDLAVAKLRAGRPAWVTLTFDGSTFAERATHPEFDAEIAAEMARRTGEKPEDVDKDTGSGEGVDL